MFPCIECKLSGGEPISLPVPDKVNIIIVSQRKSAFPIGTRWRRKCADALRNDPNFFVLHIRLSSKMFFVDSRHKSFMAELQEDDRTNTVVFYGEQSKEVSRLLDNPAVEHPMVFLIDQHGSIVEQLSGSQARSSDERIQRLITDATNLIEFGKEDLEKEESYSSIDEEKAQHLLAELQSKRQTHLNKKEFDKANVILSEIKRLERIMDGTGWTHQPFEGFVEVGKVEEEEEPRLDEEVVEVDQPIMPELKKESTEFFEPQLEEESFVEPGPVVEEPIMPSFKQEEAAEGPFFELEQSSLDQPPVAIPIESRPRDDLWKRHAALSEEYHALVDSGNIVGSEKVFKEVESVELQMSIQGVDFTSVKPRHHKRQLPVINNQSEAISYLSELQDEFRVLKARKEFDAAHEVEELIIKLEDLIEENGWKTEEFTIPTFNVEQLTKEECKEWLGKLDRQYNDLLGDLDYAKAQEVEVLMISIRKRLGELDQIEKEKQQMELIEKQQKKEEQKRTELQQVEREEEEVLPKRMVTEETMPEIEAELARDTGIDEQLKHLRAKRFALLRSGPSEHAKKIDDQISILEEQLSLMKADLEESTQDHQNPVERAEQHLESLKKSKEEALREGKSTSDHDKHISTAERILGKIKAREMEREIQTEGGMYGIGRAV
ncbi:hypothetical protein P9112_000864 [Eukaryota sp. TZLM1-RC]